MKRGWVRIVVSCFVIVGAVVITASGSAGPRTPTSVVASFDAFPGPAEASYGENIAYRADLENKTGSTLTKVRFRQTYPVGSSPDGPVESSCPAGRATTILNPDGTPKYWVCDFGQQTAGAKLALVVVWQVPPSSESANCTAGCFSTTGGWSVKEGTNDVGDPNDQFGTKTVTATLLSVGDGATETRKAGGYETGSASCSDPAAGNLRTKQLLSLQNPVSTTVCLPAFAIPAGSVDLGYVTTVTETLIANTTTPNPRHSEVCIAKLGTTCPGTDEVFFDPDAENPLVITHVFRVLDASLPKSYRITQVSHNGTVMTAATCAAVGDCVKSIDLDPKTKIWTIVVTTGTNGYFDW